MDTRRAFGNRGEARAAEFLERKGFAVIERQFRTEFGEIDLVCKDAAGWIVFVEVKTRKSLTSGHPEESVTQAKLKHLEATGEEWLRVHVLERAAHRYDVVAITESVEGEVLDILHLEGV